MANETTSKQEQPISIQDELRTSYLDYAMSVIIGRAIPDARDGLKPVHRRILFAMHEANMNPSSAYKKCATVVGDVLGKYHPHGDSAVYDALVRMAQHFSMRHMLIDGQGNFGSVDGDPAAAYRYTESRLTRAATDLLADIEKATVDMAPNFDGTRDEPTVLPTRFPNLLVNGSNGIAVGMATNIPPHNLREVVSATIHLIEFPDATIEELMRFVPGPDFPTAALIHGRAGIYQAYKTGRGSIVMRARTEVETIPGTDREQIIVREIPYQVNKARLHAKIGELMREKRIEGIREVRDESDRDGMRLVIELKKDVFPQVVLNQLYRMTDLQTAFGMNNLAIVHGRPRTLTLKDCLTIFVEHRREVVSRRTQFELAEAEARREVVEGLGMAVTEVDIVIQTIRSSRDPETALGRLMELPLRGLENFVRRAGRPEAEIAEAAARGDYRLSERQAKAILEMRLARLTGLEQEKLATEYGALSDEIARLRAILADEGLLMRVIVDELEEIRDRHGDERRTQIVEDEAEIQVEDLIQEEDMVVTVSHEGYIKRTSLSDYRAQKRGGKGNRGMGAADGDFVSQLFVESTHSMVFFFTNTGRVYVKKVYEIPQAARTGKGRAIVNFLALEKDEFIAAIAPVLSFDDERYVTTLTRHGQIKKTSVDEYRNYRQSGIIGVKITEGDSLLTACVTDAEAHFIIATRGGKSIRFDASQVRAMGRAAAGVRAIDLEDGDEAVGMASTDSLRDQVLTITERGYGKRTMLEEFRVQNRGGKGVIVMNTGERNGPIVGIALVRSSDEVVLMTDQGQAIRTRVSEIRETGRNAMGVRVMNIAGDERLVAFEVVGESDDEDAEETGDAATSESPAADGAGATGSLVDGEGAAVDSAGDDAATSDGASGDATDDAADEPPGEG